MKRQMFLALPLQLLPGPLLLQPGLDLHVEGHLQLLLRQLQLLDPLLLLLGRPLLLLHLGHHVVSQLEQKHTS